MKTKELLMVGGGKDYLAPTSMAITFKPGGIVCTSTEGNASDPALANLSVTVISGWTDDDE